MRTAKRKASAQIYSPIYVNFIDFLVSKALNVGFMFLQCIISFTVEQRHVLKANGNPDNHILCFFMGPPEFMYRIPQIQPIWKQLITFCNLRFFKAV